MTTEQKAKAYDEALEKAKIWQNHLYETNDKDYADELNYIFPELKESEDERIRKAIISYISHGQHCGVSNANMIAWLEKQGFKASETSIKDAEEEVRQYLSGSGNEKYIAEFMERYANWNRQREEWDRSLLEALIQRGKPY